MTQANRFETLFVIQADPSGFYAQLGKLEPEVLRGKGPSTRRRTPELFPRAAVLAGSMLQLSQKSIAFAEVVRQTVSEIEEFERVRRETYERKLAER